MKSAFEETRNVGCPSGYGSKTERRDFEVWSNNDRNHSDWYVNHDSCTRPKKSGSTYLVSALAKHTLSIRRYKAVLSINNANGSLSCSVVSTSSWLPIDVLSLGDLLHFNYREGDTHTYGPFSNNYASCSISGNSGTVWGNCDAGRTTVGGNKDYCIPATKMVTVNNTSSDGCIIYMTVNGRSANVDTCR